MEQHGELFIQRLAVTIAVQRLIHAGGCHTAVMLFC